MPNRRDLIIAGTIVLAAGAVTMAVTPGTGRFGMKTGLSGMIAPGVPDQEDLPRPEVRFMGDATLTLFASFSLEAMVLSARRCEDTNGDLIPYDLALGWAAASDPSLLRNISISQGGRWYSWRAKWWEDVPPGFETSSANMHMIPASAEVLQALSEVRPGDGVRIAGHLCDVDRPGAPTLRSSRSRNDTGNGACEVVVVDNFEIFL